MGCGGKATFHCQIAHGLELDPSSLQVFSRADGKGSSSRLAAVIFLFFFIVSPPHHTTPHSSRLDLAVQAWRSIYTGTQLELIRRRQSSPPVVFDVIHDSSHNYDDEDEDEDVGDNSLPNSDSNFQAASQHSIERMSGFD